MQCMTIIELMELKYNSYNRFYTICAWKTSIFCPPLHLRGT